MSSVAERADQSAEVDPVLMALISRLDHTCKNGGEIPALIADVESEAPRIRNLSDTQLVDLLSAMSSKQALALMLLVLGRVDAESLRAIRPSFANHKSVEVRVASYWGLVIQQVDANATKAAIETFWRQAFGLLLFISVAPPEGQTDFVLLTRPSDDDSVLTTLIDSMQSSSDPGMRSLCMSLLAHSRQDSRVLDASIRLLLEDATSGVRQSAARSLSGISSPQVVDALRATAERDLDERVRAASLLALANGGSLQVIEYLVASYDGARSLGEKRAIVAGVGRSPFAVSTEFLSRIVRSDDHVAVRGEAIKALGGKRGDALATRALVDALTVGDHYIRIASVVALGDTADESAIPTLERVAEFDQEESIRNAAKEALQKLRK